MPSLLFSQCAVLPLALLLLLFSCSIRTTSAFRVLAFKWLENSGTCHSIYGDWNVQLGSFHVDCGNANHGCTPGHNIMIYGDFFAGKEFPTVTDVDIKACEFGSLVCTPNFIETEINFCYDLALQNLYGESACNEKGNYTFETNYMLPTNRSLWQDVAFEGLKFNIVVLLDDDLECRGTFVTRVYYQYEKWMTLAVASIATVGALLYYAKQKQYFDSNFSCLGRINLQVEEERAEEEAKAEAARAKDGRTLKGNKKNWNNPQSRQPNNTIKTTPTIQTVRTGGGGDEESVTSTSYLRMLDFSPEGLSHQDRMEQVRQAHFERLRKTRDSRRTKRASASADDPLEVNSILACASGIKEALAPGSE